MSYGHKKKESSGIIERIKDTATLVPGNHYHLRKMIRQEGNTVWDEVHDIVLKEVKEGFLIEQDTEEQFSSTEFEIFQRVSAE